MAKNDDLICDKRGEFPIKNYDNNIKPVQILLRFNIIRIDIKLNIKNALTTLCIVRAQIL